MAITDWPVPERPRERLLSRGADALSDAELLAVLLRSGNRHEDVVSLARRLLGEFGSVRGLLDGSAEQLLEVRGLGAAGVGSLLAARALGERYLAAPVIREAVFRGSVDVRRYLRQRLGGREQEVFAALFLDTQHRLIRFEELFFGTVDSATIHPREVLRRVIQCNAAAVIFAHNHPSGIAEPSGSDLAITERLKSLLECVDVRVLDHLVVSASQVVSMAERGLV
jgi:DNA repair protein RadC